MLRKAVVADIPRLKVIRSSVVENVLGDASKVLDAHYEWFVANPGICLWEERGDIVAFSAADPRDGSIWALFVLPGFEGKGIGTALLEAACTVLKAAGLTQAQLTTDPGTRAERFYRSSGWQLVGIKDNELLFERIF